MMLISSVPPKFSGTSFEIRRSRASTSSPPRLDLELGEEG